MVETILVEDNQSLRQALKSGLEASGAVRVVAEFSTGEKVVAHSIQSPPDVVLMDVHLAGEMNGIEAAVLIRREFPRLPVVFYSIQDDDTYYRDFLHSGILTHFAYVRKSNFLLPESILPLLHDAVSGRSFIDPEIEERVQEVRLKDEYDPLALLEPNEQAVVSLLAQGLTNEQIASRLGFHDKRAVSRTNGQVYAAWRLNETPTDEKVARTRAAIIYHQRRLIIWDADGGPLAADRHGEWQPVDLDECE